MEEFFEKAVETHLTFMKKSNDSIPIWLIILKNEGMNIYAIVNRINQSPMQKISSLILSEQPEAYVLFSEGWTTRKMATTEESLNFIRNYKYGSIKDLPDKKEVLTVMGRSKDGKHEINKVFYIKRDSKNNVIEFLEDKIGKLEAKLP